MGLDLHPGVSTASMRYEGGRSYWRLYEEDHDPHTLFQTLRGSHIGDCPVPERRRLHRWRQQRSRGFFDGAAELLSHRR